MMIGSLTFGVSCGVTAALIAAYSTIGSLGLVAMALHGLADG